jgi:hypothetical protein
MFCAVRVVPSPDRAGRLADPRAETAAWMNPEKRRARAIAERIGSAVVLLALPFGVFYWANPLFTDRYPAVNTLGNDYSYFSIQEQYELQFSLWHGTVPLYVPGYSGGQSASALTLGQFFHPLSLLASVMPQYWDTAEPTNWNGHALQINTLLRLLSLGITQLVLYRLIRSWGLDVVLSFAASWVTVYNMRMLDAFLYGASLENFTGFLLLVAAILWTCDHPARRAGPIWIIVCTYLLVCGGHPQTMYYGLWGALLVSLIAPYFVAAVRESHCPWPTALAFYRRGLPAFAVGVLTASLYTLPFYLDFLRQNAGRADQSWFWSCNYQATPFSVLNGFFNPYYSDVHSAVGGSDLMILGGLAPLLVFFRRRVPRVVLVVWLLCVVLLAYATGSVTPVHYLVWKYLPLASVFRAPGRALLILVVLLLLLLVWVARCPRLAFSFRDRARAIPAYVPLAAVALALYILVNEIPPEIFGPSALRVKELRVGDGWHPAALAAIPTWVHQLVFATGLVSLGALMLHGLVRRGRAVVGIVLVLATVAQVTAVLRYGTWHGHGWPNSSWQYMANMKRQSVNYQLALGCGMGTQAVAKHIRYTTMEPRLARLCTQYTAVVSNDEVYDRLACDWPRDNLLVEGLAQSPDVLLPDGVPVVEPGSVFLTYNSFNKVIFDVDAGCTAFFVLSFPFSSHWRAYVNGEPAHVWRVNGIEQAVVLPPGGHVVEFRYVSWGAMTGMSISCLTGCAVAWYALGGLRRRAPRAVGRGFAVLVFLVLFAGWYYSLYHGTSLGTEYVWPADVAYVAPRVAC